MSALSVNNPTNNAFFITQANPNETNSSTRCARIAKVIHQIAQTVLITIGILLNPITDFVTQGLSDFLGLETLRHGTSLQNYYAITKYGADPAYGGTDNGSSKGVEEIVAQARDKKYAKTSQNYFHAFEDIKWTWEKLPILGASFVRIGPRMHAFFSGSTHGIGPAICKNVSGMINGIASLIFSPTLKFRFLSEEVTDQFERDPYYGIDVALRTVHKIPSDRLGLTGIFQQGVQGNIGTRQRQDPIKTLSGLIRLINPLGLALLLGFGLYAAGYQIARHKNSAMKLDVQT